MDRDELRSALREIATTHSDSVVRPVATPEWPKLDGHIYVRAMSVTGRERYLDSIRSVTMVAGEMDSQRVKVFLAEAGAKLAAATMCDERGNLLFSAEDVAWLGELSHDAMQRVLDVSSELNALDEKAAERIKNGLSSAAVSV
jgi:hypothetical protein